MGVPWVGYSNRLRCLGLLFRAVLVVGFIIFVQPTSILPKYQLYNPSPFFPFYRKHGDIVPLLDVEDMVLTYEPDWKCVYTYLVEFYKRIRDLDLN